MATQEAWDQTREVSAYLTGQATHHAHHHDPRHCAALAGAALAMLPDADVIGFRFGVEYADGWGHRGATHALLVAGLMAGVVAAVWRAARNWPAFLFLAISMASHGLLDAFTNGGLGIALLWPFDDVRLFAPVTPIRVSPIGAGFFSARGWETLLSELRWIWLPCGALAALSTAARRARTCKIAQLRRSMQP